jgi:hypothetical protein
MWNQPEIRLRYNRRIYVFLGVVVLMSFILLGRMVQLQWL